MTVTSGVADRLTVHRMHSLPPLAWLATVSGERIEVICGQSVEEPASDRRHGFFEGCWAGDFSSFDIETSCDVFGSGGFVQNGDLVLVTPSHPLENVFVLTRGDGLAASNSLPFIMSYGQLDVRRMRDIGAKHNTILKGIDGYVRTLYDDGTARLDRYARSIITIGPDGISDRPTPEDPDFSSFAEYRQRLKDVMAQCARNADDPQRRRRYQLLMTLTSGYDSPAVAVLAKELGCRDAMTVATGRYNLNDSGEPAAAALGLDCTVCARPTPDTIGPSTDAEFLAAFCPGDRFFAAFDGSLTGKMLVTGHHGGLQWNLSGPDRPYERTGGGSGMGLREFRLRNDFLLLPVPMIGARYVPKIRAISWSEDMAPFRVGGAYDRPIPRRLALEGGVPAEAFGRRKAVASQAFWEWGFAPETIREADRLAREILTPRERLAEQGMRAGSHTLRWLLRPPKPAAVSAAVAKLRLPLGRRLSRRYARRLNVRPYRDVMTLWGLERVARRYNEARGR